LCPFLSEEWLQNRPSHSRQCFPMAWGKTLGILVFGEDIKECLT
jgi:hypothetical protein